MPFAHYLLPAAYFSTNYQLIINNTHKKKTWTTQAFYLWCKWFAFFTAAIHNNRQFYMLELENIELAAFYWLLQLSLQNSRPKIRPKSFTFH